MKHFRRLAYFFLAILGIASATGAEWSGFRGPGGLGTSTEKGLPVQWSSQKNIVWKAKLPGAGHFQPGHGRQPHLPDLLLRLRTRYPQVPAAWKT